MCILHLGSTKTTNKMTKDNKSKITFADLDNFLKIAPIIGLAILAYLQTLFPSKDEFKEIQKIQDAYINCLADETNMTVAQIKKYLKQKTNVYLTAEEAVKLGLADEIF